MLLGSWCIHNNNNNNECIYLCSALFISISIAEYPSIDACCVCVRVWKCFRYEKPAMDLPGYAPTYRHCGDIVVLHVADDGKHGKYFCEFLNRRGWWGGKVGIQTYSSVTALTPTANDRLIFIDFHFSMNKYVLKAIVVAAPHSYSTIFSINFAISSLSMAKIDRKHIEHAHRTNAPRPRPMHVDDRRVCLRIILLIEPARSANANARGVVGR